MPTPTNEEQLMLQYVNLLRTNPQGEYARLTSPAAYAQISSSVSYFGVSLPALQQQLSGLAAVAPLAWNETLATAATAHNAVMIAQDAQEHQLPGEASVGARLTAAGYNWTAVAENIFAYSEGAFYGHAGFVIDWGYDAEDVDANGSLYSDWKSRGDGMQDPAGHRSNLMNASVTEIGIAITPESNARTAVGPYVTTEDFGRRAGYQAQFLGVVINDADKDAFYDIGEGMGGVTVTLTSASGASYTTTSWSSGGWQVAVPTGSYAIRFSGGGLTGTIERSAAINGQNVKIDVLAGEAVSTPATPVGALASALADILVGTAGNDVIDGLGGDDSITGLAGDDVLMGSAGNDTLVGGAGADTLNGGAGNDRLDGGEGNDTYLVDAFGDVVVEGADGDTADIVYAVNSYTLGADARVENFAAATAVATVGLALTGNQYGQAIAGGYGNDTLQGAGSSVNGGDILIGLRGDDLYVVDAPNILLIEAAGAIEGNDTATILASASGFVLNGDSYVENLVAASGTAAINITGSMLAQRIVGNAGSNLLSTGGGGADTLDGGVGDDVYRVHGTVTILDAGGNDAIYTSGTFRLNAGAAIELVTAAVQAGTEPIDITGNETAQTIIGNYGGNVLDGRGGSDTLIGLNGNDTFVFSTALGAGNVDTIQDFAAGDRIALASDVFAVGGAVTGSNFVLGTAARDGDDRILYDQASGNLFYDADGNGAGAALPFARLAAGTPLSAADFTVIAPIPAV